MKTKPNESVVHDWVSSLTFQMQALLMTSMRGPDGSEKHCAAKAIVRYLRGVVLKPAGDWSGKNDNDFMWGDFDVFNEWARTFWNDHDHYPHHFIMHLVHCAQVIGTYHPEFIIRDQFNRFYLEACKSFHMYPESKSQLENRLNDFGTSKMIV